MSEHTWRLSDRTIYGRTVESCFNCGRLHIPTDDDPSRPVGGCKPPPGSDNSRTRTRAHRRVSAYRRPGA